MSSNQRAGGTVQQYFHSVSTNSPPAKLAKHDSTPVGDGFTADEVQDALTSRPNEWHPEHEYEDSDIGSLQPGTRPVMFMGRVANIFDLGHNAKTPRSAKGCLKLCVKDAQNAITVRLWYASKAPVLRLGSLVTIWTNHISNGQNGSLASSSAPLFASLFPERDRNCYLMLHENSDDCKMFKTPMGYREGLPLDGLMTLKSFEDGGYDVTDARLLVVVKNIGTKRKVTRKDGRTTDNVNLHVQDDTSTATVGLWGSLAASPAIADDSNVASETATACRSWTPGATVLLLQNPGFKFGHPPYLNFTSATIVDVDPNIPDAHWLRRWSARQASREAINPPFPASEFDPLATTNNPRRCLFSIADLDDFARCTTQETFQGYLNVLIMETRLLELWRRNMLLCGECCNTPLHANALGMICEGCNQQRPLRLNPRIMGQVIDETAAIASGKLLFSDQAWRKLLGREPEDVLKLGYNGIKYLSDRLLFSRITMLFGWTGDESKAGGRICILRVYS